MLSPPGPPLPLLQLPPDFSAQDVVHERTVRLANYRGHAPVMIVFLGQPLSPMRQQMDRSLVAVLNQRQADFHAFGEILLVGQASALALRTLAAQLGLDLPLLHDPDGFIYRAYRTGYSWRQHWPAQFITDVQGRLRYYHLSSLLHPYPTATQLLAILAQVASLTSPLSPPRVD